MIHCMLPFLERFHVSYALVAHFQMTSISVCSNSVLKHILDPVSRHILITCMLYYTESSTIPRYFTVLIVNLSKKKKKIHLEATPLPDNCALLATACDWYRLICTKIAWNFLIFIILFVDISLPFFSIHFHEVVNETERP